MLSGALFAPAAPTGGLILDAAQSEAIEAVTELLAARTDRFAREETMHIAVTVVRASSRHELDPMLLLAVIEVESSYKRRGRSPVGALGLMQIMPSTAEAFAETAGLRWRGPNSLMEPETNIEIGAAYLAYLLGRFDGDRELALAAYCHGPAAIRRSLRANGCLAERERGYGRRVLSVWRALHDEDGPSGDRAPAS
jgi:soluble lytic murein transglycosylase-like protein